MIMTSYCSKISNQWHTWNNHKQFPMCGCSGSCLNLLMFEQRFPNNQATNQIPVIFWWSCLWSSFLLYVGRLLVVAGRWIGWNDLKYDKLQGGDQRSSLLQQSPLVRSCEGHDLSIGTDYLASKYRIVKLGQCCCASNLAMRVMPGYCSTVSTLSQGVSQGLVRSKMLLLAHVARQQ